MSVMQNIFCWLAQIDQRRYFYLLLVGIALIVGANVLDLLVGRPSWTITRTIFLGFEQTISTWWSAVLLASSGMMAYWCYRTSHQRNIRPAFGWLLIAAVLFALSCDEVASLHETLGGYLSKGVAPSAASKWTHTAWPIVLGPLAILFTVAVALIIRKHFVGGVYPGVLILAGAAVLLGAGVGLESTTNWLNHNELQWLWDLEIIAEEAGEMLGAWLIGFGLVVRGEQLLAMDAS